MNAKVAQIPISDILLDYKNPRISEFGFTKKSPESEILKVLWDEMAVNEIMLSITSNGYWDYEPLIVIKESSNYIVIEGNRRLAAIKLIHDNQNIVLPKTIKENITENLKKDTSSLPCMIVNSRQAAWKFIGFKHVNGPAKWGSFAKAKYLSEIHNDFGIPLNDIAKQIGDTNKTAQKLYQGLMVLEQAKASGVYDYDNIQADRIYFSHLYTGIQRDGIRNFINLKDASDESPTPVPDDSLEDLGEFLTWLYGNKITNEDSIIKSQNPDLKHLDEVLKNRESIAALRSGENLDYAYEISRSNESVFEENLLTAKRSLQKAKGYITTGYEGAEELLKVAISVANLADALYEEMHKIKLEKTGRTKKHRTLD